MSQPKRYNLAWTAKAEDPEQGAWVEYSDYAALAAENERLKALIEENLNLSKRNLGKTDAIRIERDTLTAENERLRKASFVTAIPDEQYERVIKAGDQMDAYLKRQDGTTNGMLDCRRAWLEAKEGGSK